MMKEDNKTRWRGILSQMQIRLSRIAWENYAIFSPRFVKEHIFLGDRIWGNDQEEKGWIIYQKHNHVFGNGREGKYVSGDM